MRGPLDAPLDPLFSTFWPRVPLKAKGVRSRVLAKVEADELAALQVLRLREDSKAAGRILDLELDRADVPDMWKRAQEHRKAQVLMNRAITDVHFRRIGLPRPCACGMRHLWEDFVAERGKWRDVRAERTTNSCEPMVPCELINVCTKTATQARTHPIECSLLDIGDDPADETGADAYFLEWTMVRKPTKPTLEKWSFGGNTVGASGLLVWAEEPGRWAIDSKIAETQPWTATQAGDRGTQLRSRTCEEVHKIWVRGRDGRDRSIDMTNVDTNRPIKTIGRWGSITGIELEARNGVAVGDTENTEADNVERTVAMRIQLRGSLQQLLLDPRHWRIRAGNDQSPPRSGASSYEHFMFHCPHTQPARCAAKQREKFLPAVLPDDPVDRRKELRKTRKHSVARFCRTAALTAEFEHYEYVPPPPLTWLT